MAQKKINKSTKPGDIKEVIRQFIKVANKFDVTAALKLFAGNAVIDDVSVGHKFEKHAGVRKYLEQFFVGYHTMTKLQSVTIVNLLEAKAQLDFTGDFGHETGALDVTLNSKGLIIKIDAYLD